MKPRIILTVAVLVAVIVLAVGVLVFPPARSCSLCKAASYDSPCFIDLKTGDVLELSLDGPSETGAVGNTSVQSTVETFSFIRFGRITGTKQTAPSVIKLKIPSADKVNAPALCRRCRKMLQQGYDGRYVLADMNGKILIPFIASTEVAIEGYEITMVLRDGEIIVTIQENQ